MSKEGDFIKNFMTKFLPERKSYFNPYDRDT